MYDSSSYRKKIDCRENDDMSHMPLPLFFLKFPSHRGIMKTKGSDGVE